MDDAVAGRIAAVSQALVSARLSARALDAFPGELPRTLQDAYRVQGLSIAAWPDHVAGWKIGSTPGAFREAVGEERLAGPIFAKNVRRAHAGETVPMGVYAGGFAAVEAELVFQLGRDMRASGGAATREEALSLIAAVHVGVEIASSPLRVINDLGPMSIVSDFGNNAGLVVGAEIADWCEIDSIEARVVVDGALAGATDAASIHDAPIAALQFLIDKCRERSIPLGAGAWVSTGALTGVHEAAPGARARIAFGRYGEIDIALEPIAPA